MKNLLPRPYLPITQVFTAILQIATEHHRAGRSEAAEALYREILELDPRHADTLFLLGVLERQTGRCSQARQHLAEALRWAADRTQIEAELRNVERILSEQRRKSVQGWTTRLGVTASDCAVPMLARA